MDLRGFVNTAQQVANLSLKNSCFLPRPLRSVSLFCYPRWVNFISPLKLLLSCHYISKYLDYQYIFKIIWISFTLLLISFMQFCWSRKSVLEGCPGSADVTTLKSDINVCNAPCSCHLGLKFEENLG